MIRCARWLLAVTQALTLTGAFAAPLPPDIDIALDRAKVPREALAVVVQEVGSPRMRLDWQAQVPMNPASLTKLITTAAGLELLGPAYTWPTNVWLQGPISQGVLDGNLVIKGNGDPKLVVERLWLLLHRVQQSGVREIRGDLVIDRSAFEVPTELPPGQFDGEASRPYNVQPDALLLNFKSYVLTFTPDTTRKVVQVTMEPPLAGVRLDAQVALTNGPCEDWRSGLKAEFGQATVVRVSGSYSATCEERSWSVAYPDPKSYNERALTGLWREMGGKLTGRVREGTAPTTPPSFSVNSPALAELVRDINKFSNNVMAQQLFLTLGLKQRGLGTPQNARAVVQQWLAQHHGEAAAQASVVDTGSGLSLETRLSAEMLARVLQTAWGSATMPELMSSLPIAGADGTMRRSRNTPQGRAHIKTGSMPDSGIMGRAGYVLGNSGRRYVVVAVVNHPRARFAQPVLEAVLQWAALDGGATPTKE